MRPDAVLGHVTEGEAALEVVAVGVQATVQDLGRPLGGALGVPLGGAADRAALRLANRLVGNPEGLAGLEILLGGLELMVHAPVVVALAGASASLHRARAGVSTAMPLGCAVVLQPGDRCRVGPALVGLRSYLGIRGGVAGRPVLGSVSASPTAGVGPAPLQPGDVIGVNGDAGLGPVPERGMELVAPVSSPVGDLELDAFLGPRQDLFTPDSVAQLGSGRWLVSADADRVGVRLEGAVLQRAGLQRAGLGRGAGAELPSEPMVPGAIQVPPSGQPIVFGPDHPTTGGYPVIAVLAASDRDALWQARPGTGVRLRLRQVGWCRP